MIIHLLVNLDNNLQQLLTKIGENNITITTADIFFGVSGVEKATELLNSLKTAQADLVDKMANNSPQEQVELAFFLIHKILRDYIELIQKDRIKIKKRIVEIFRYTNKIRY